jgi:YegS/Rv2252/BmrU family lipid kinase
MAERRTPTRRRAERAPAASATAVRQVAVVFNPVSNREDPSRRRRELLRALEAAGVEALLEETTEEDGGVQAARHALEQGADLVLAAGGDGTVMACATALASSDVPLAVLPSGTGNLLAVNLGLPADLEGAIEVALHGRRRRLDVGAVGDDRFVVMSGMGFDAAMLRDASSWLKARIGALAYVLSGLRQLGRRPAEFTIRLDDLPSISRVGQGVLVGNLGRIQGGLEVLPGADPDDGLLDVGVLDTRSLGGWPRLARQVLLGHGRRPTGPPLELFRARRVEIDCNRPEPVERDGEPGAPTRHLAAEAVPGALILCVPDAERPTSRSGP